MARTSFWGVRIVSLEPNRVLFERNAERLFLPASNAKLFTTALALSRLGPDYRFQTRVAADRTVGEDGCVESLRLIGGGDPNLSGRAIPYRRDAPPGDPLAAIDDLAAQVAAHGVRRVTADIIGDDSAYVWQPYPDGWSIDDPVWDYGAAVSALCINDNTISVGILPGGNVSDPARLVLTPPVEYYEIDNRVRTVAPAGEVERKIAVERLPGVRQLRIWGDLPLHDSGDTEVLGIDDPALYAACAFRDALLRRGIVIRGEPRALHLYPNQVADLRNGPAPEPEPGVELAQRDSAPLLEDLRITDKVSQNLHAEMALRAVAKARGHIGSREAGLAQEQAFLDEIGIDRAQLHLRGWLRSFAPRPGIAGGRGPPSGFHVEFGLARCLGEPASSCRAGWHAPCPVFGHHRRRPPIRQDRHALPRRGALRICPPPGRQDAGLLHPGE